MPRWKVPLLWLDQKPSWWAVQPPSAAALVISSGERVTTTTWPPGRAKDRPGVGQHVEEEHRGDQVEAAPLGAGPAEVVVRVEASRPRP